LNHESGFGDYHGPEYFNLSKDEKKLQAIVSISKSVELNFEPGTENDYSNLGYVLLGAIIEKATGKTYFENVQERIVDRLELKNTYLNDFKGLEARIANGYYYTPLGELEENVPTQDQPNPDGGFLSTTEDILKFYTSYYTENELLSKEVKLQDPLFKYLKEIPKGQATGAAGGFPGFNTSLFFVPSDDLTIIVFANMDEPVAERISSDILTLYHGETPAKPELPAVQNVRKAFEKYGVEYIKENFEDLTINFHPTDPKDFILNDLAYAYFYGANDLNKALELFKLNVELFPNVANCWDSYGEALTKAGNKKEAITAYEKALAIRPNLETSKKALSELKSKN
jgi:tetratricopeptide (TPR) repeat protein